MLPETYAAAAHKVAERCCALIFKEQIHHEDAPSGQVLTVSIGIGSIVPATGDEPMAFIETVDKRLYKAKQAGRNRIEDDRQRSA